MKFISKILFVALLLGGASDALVGMEGYGSSYDNQGRRKRSARLRDLRPVPYAQLPVEQFNQQPEQQGSSFGKKITGGIQEIWRLTKQGVSDIKHQPACRLALGSCGLIKKGLGKVVRHYTADGFFNGGGKLLRDTGILLMLTGYGSSESMKESLGLDEPVTTLMAASGAILCIVVSKLTRKGVKLLGQYLQGNKDSHQREENRERLVSVFKNYIGRDPSNEEIDRELMRGIPERRSRERSCCCAGEWPWCCSCNGICTFLRGATIAFMFFDRPDSLWFFVPGTEFSQLIIERGTFGLPDDLSSWLIMNGLIVYLVDYQFLFGSIKNIKDYISYKGII